MNREVLDALNAILDAPADEIKHGALNAGTWKKWKDRLERARAAAAGCHAQPQTPANCAFCRQAKFDLSTEAGRIAAHAAYAARAEAATAYIWKDPSKLTSAAIQLVNAWENRANLHPDVIDEGMRCLRDALKEAAKP